MKLFIPVCLLFFLLACQHKKDVSANMDTRFDQAKWKIKEGETYPYREAMVDHLRDSINLKNISYDSLMQLLGAPDRINEGHLYYHIYKKEVGAVTLGTQAFVIRLKPDSTVEWRKTYGR
jgi:hypothetical protein